VGPRFDDLAEDEGPDPVSNTLGESRKVFASHFFTRSDIYFHSGYYPSIFDRSEPSTDDHLAESVGAREAKSADPEHANHAHDGQCNHGEEKTFLGKPKDWMDGFGRHFFVSTHTHLTEKGTNAAREILPWIKLTAQLDPQKIESYTVGAYWLQHLDRTEEAEQFLREGLWRNPQSYEIQIELGRMFFEKRDFVRARNLFELAIRCWRDQENAKPAEQRNLFAARQILNYLAAVEERLGNRERAVEWLEIVKGFSPNPDEIDKRIREVRAGHPLSAR
jgi:hypothetical protein